MGQDLGSLYMKKTFLRFSLIGMTVAGILVWYAYFSNRHQDAPRLGDLAYLIACPPSICLMATENASAPVQVFIVSVVIALNGLLYGAVALSLRSLVT
jgi:hypothetical protein